VDAADEPIRRDPGYGQEAKEEHDQARIAVDENDPILRGMLLSSLFLRTSRR
jgi:hypothetical protein